MDHRLSASQRRLLTLAIVAVVVLAACFRLPRLADRPMHCDEANQAARSGRLYDKGEYTYDAHDHHGPTLYYLTLPALWLSGTPDYVQSDETVYRLVPVLFGVGLVVLVFLLADGLTPGATIAAAVFAALSPTMVFYSRYYIQETLLVFFTLTAIGSAWRFVRSRHVGWAILAGTSFGLMHATKETWILSAAALGAAAVMTLAWSRWRDGHTDALAEWRAHIRPLPLLAAVAAACVVAVLFYSSFGRNPSGPWDSILAYATYFRRGVEGEMQAQPWHYYFGLLLYYRPVRGFYCPEAAIAVLALIGVVWPLVARNNENAEPGVTICPSLGLWRFLAFYTVVLALLYSAISYKTPWCSLGFLHGMILLAGLAAWNMIGRLKGWSLRMIAALLILVGLVHLGRQSYWLNYRAAVDQTHPYGHTYTGRDALKLAARIEQLAAVSPEGRDMVVHVIVPENFWPLPWHLRRLNRAGYWLDVAQWREDTAGDPAPSVIIVAADISEQVDPFLGARYNQQSLYGLRPPGVLVSAYVRQDLWDAMMKAAAER